MPIHPKCRGAEKTGWMERPSRERVMSVTLQARGEGAERPVFVCARGATGVQFLLFVCTGGAKPAVKAPQSNERSRVGLQDNEPEKKVS